MTTIYTSVSINGYNASPPADDGTVTPSNKVNWSKHKEKLADPIKTLAETINTNVNSAFGKMFHNATTQLTTNATLSDSDRGKTFVTTNSLTVTLEDPSTVGSNYFFTLVNSDGGEVIIDADTNTINGSSTLIIGEANRGAFILCDGGEYYAMEFGNNIEESPLLTPVSGTIPYFGNTEPSGGIWKFPNGQAISRTDYSELFSLIGTTYGTGNGSTTFNIPDIRERTLAAWGGMATPALGLLTGQPGGVDAGTIGNTGGSESHTLTEDEMPSHTHSIGAGNVATFASGTTGADRVTANRDTGSTGGDQPHNNVQPTFIVPYLMRCK